MGIRTSKSPDKTCFSLDIGQKGENLKFNIDSAFK